MKLLQVEQLWTSLIMAIRRQISFWRLRRRVALFIFTIILISMGLMYRALMSHHDKSQPTDISFPSMLRHSPHFHPKANLSHAADYQLVVKLPQLVNKLYYNLNSNELASLKLRDLLSSDSKIALGKFLQRLYPLNWAEAPETDEMALELKHTLLDYGLDSNLSCRDIDRFRLGSSLAYSRSKSIDVGYENSFGANGVDESVEMALRSFSNDINTKISCMKQIYDSELCSTMGNYRLLREVLLLTVFQHPGILKLKGYCLRGNRQASQLHEKGVVLVTEIGTPLTSSILMSSTWAQRVKMALQIGHLLLFLESSPLGSMRLSKLDLKDFVLVDEQVVKLADLDDLEVGEKTCFRDMDCVIQEASRGVRCTKNVCEGLNALNNLFLTLNVAFIPLLRNPPTDKDKDFVFKLKNFKLDTEEMVVAMEAMFSKLPTKQTTEPINAQVNSVKSFKNKFETQKDIDEINKAWKKVVIKDDAELELKSFQRLDERNFAGVYDYPCPGSRVVWGCVFTVSSLGQAARLCLSDDHCMAFITFTTSPETEKLMTIVLKNATDGSPNSSSGTTLFVRILHKEEEEEEEEEEDEELSAKSSDELTTCMDNVIYVQESARLSRENRLMTHLGLKGMDEKVWQRSVIRQKMGAFSRLSKLESGGGKFDVNLTTTPNSTDEVKKVTFLAENGPKLYHVSYAVVYQLDRLLGLYHVPPCVTKQLPATVVNRYLKSENWEETFKPLVEADGTLTGVMTVPTPRVMKTSKLSLTPVESLSTFTEFFDRTKKMQLEYVLLWWLGKISIFKDEHLGYKGHLIHFNADKGFVNKTANFTEYLNSCQFPNVVYKSLSCFRCINSAKQSSVKPSVCGLGNEVMQRTHDMFTEEVDITIHKLTELQLSQMIDKTATEIMTIVQKCITLNGRENVLY
ncbi:uncharacterized protein LOC131931006 [Physella acuta]|uniref:uncharacterized protein LOC131931006 n=1 Tax=Physella acuta TaxID=109671 RepID=UPI0027DB1F7E|nr:uncharacterized protein LOC131931006 [Physella acuta]XP_059143670.1 uncharacterized protein LOC131931006 [Physella acuta]XP_059143671.1 uncharacterized protein LOC131931006 [Physella acuta]XP_059143672.1 uncharacterized protein LOC131931006 [Physella acuta]